MRIASVAKVALASIALAACGNSVAGPATLSPSAATVLVGDRTTFALAPAQSATWSVNGMPGGNGTVGTISSIGVYTAPLVVPSPSTVAVGASAATNTAVVSIVSRFVDDGPFAVESCPVSGACLGAVAAPDLDRDGLSDLIAAGTASGTLSVIMRANPSSFSPPVSYDVGVRATSQPRSLVAGDWNGDGILDVAVADADPLKGQAVGVWLGGGDGHGTLRTEVRTPLVALSDPVSIASGHFDTTLNTTRNLDVVVARFGTVLVPSSLVVLLGDGTGTFPDFKTITDGVSNPRGVVVADFDNDTRDDIAVANSSGAEGGTVAVFLGIGDGTLQNSQTYTVPGSPSALAAVDLNNDGFLDLAVTSSADNTLRVLLNQGTLATPLLTFNPPSVSYGAGTQPVAVVAADFNRDGARDLAVLSQAGNAVRIFLGHGDGTLVASETYPVGVFPRALAVGDFNGDGRTDLAVTNGGDDTVTILRNRGQ